MMDHAAKALADWLNGATPENTAPPDAIWACVEIFGHRKHYGRVTEVEKFGTKMLRIDVPTVREAPLLGQPETFETFIYGGGSIFSLTPMTEEASRKWADYERPKPYNEVARLPSPDRYNDEEHAAQ